MKRLVILLALLCISCSIPQEQGSIEAHFCPAGNCEGILANLIADAEESVDCAFYSLSSEEVLNAIGKSNAKKRFVFNKKIEVDARSTVRPDYLEGLMHNKFCIIDGKRLITGSYNPNGRSYLNNILIIESSSIVQNYNDEFRELYSGKFKGGKPTRNQEVILNGKLVESYFCPEDNCRKKAIDALRAAKKSIYFFVFSFTDDDIASLLLEKEVKVRGIMESSQVSRWSVYDKLENKIDVELFRQGVMHNKVFVIDNKTVITGSWNPTNSGSERNDENMLIIHDEKIAMQYVNEFLRWKNG